MSDCIHCGEPVETRRMFEFVARRTVISRGTIVPTPGALGARPVDILTHVGGHERCEGRDTLAETADGTAPSPRLPGTGGTPQDQLHWAWNYIRSKYGSSGEEQS